MQTPLQQFYLDQLGIQIWVQPHEKKRENALQALKEKVAACQNCALHSSRSQTVFARGNPQAKLMIIGEAPGYYEDKQGLPFVGKAGGLLNSMMQSIGLTDNDFYIANVLKCRPPNNRDPKPEEIAACRDLLQEQIQLISPKIIFAVGRFAGNFLVGGTTTLTNMRQTRAVYQNIPVLVSFHPAYLLRNPSDKKKAFTDLLRLKGLLKDHVE